jgi:hypothetical protein
LALDTRLSTQRGLYAGTQCRVFATQRSSLQRVGKAKLVADRILSKPVDVNALLREFKHLLDGGSDVLDGGARA